jgi:hypothetical protein
MGLVRRCNRFVGTITDAGLQFDGIGLGTLAFAMSGSNWTQTFPDLVGLFMVVFIAIFDDVFFRAIFGVFFRAIFGVFFRAIFGVFFRAIFDVFFRAIVFPIHVLFYK